MRRLLRKMCILAMAAVMALGTVPVSAYAGNAHFTFTNLKEDQPDLYVTKSVTSALDGYSAPDTDFTFVLKWDRDGDGYLEFAESASYFVYDEMGVQVKNPDTSDGSFRTSSTGRFTLKAGQYARFEWAGQVEYEVYEEEEGGYTQILPAGGDSASGTVAPEGTIVDFENLYVPVTTGRDETMLAIRKDAAWPAGYETPDSSDIEFTFTVKVDGSVYANEPYTLYNADMTEEIGNGRTDGSGTLAIMPGTVAVFDGIEVGVDYEVTEQDSEGWRAVGNTENAGSTTAPITYNYFTNEPTAFSVAKERSDGATGVDDRFTFTLTDGDGEPMADVPYYVYEDGKLTGGELTTDGAGQFSLKAGQEALFLGLAEGTEYSVTEDDAPGYAGNSEEYSGEAGYGADVCTFTNTQLNSITVKKFAKDRSNVLLGGAEFTLYRLKDGADADDAPDADWEQCGGPLVTCEDEDDGAYGTLTFTDLPAGTYKIVETKAPDGYEAYGDPIIVTLPYEMSEYDAAQGHVDTESDSFTGIYSERDGVYYLYDVTYDVYNTLALMELPSMGGYAWAAVLLAVIGGAIAIAAVMAFKYNGRSLRRKRRQA